MHMKLSMFSRLKMSLCRRLASVLRSARIAALRLNGGITFRRFLACNLTVAFVGLLCFSSPFSITAHAETGAVSDATVSIGSPGFSYLIYEGSTLFIEDGTSTSSSTIYTFCSYVNFTFNVTGSNASDRRQYSGLVNVTFNHAIPSIAGFTTFSIRTEVLSASMQSGETAWAVVKGAESNSASTISIGYKSNGYSPSAGGTVNLKVIYSMRATASTSNPATVVGTLPTGSCSMANATISYATLDEFDPEYKLLFGYYDSQGAWHGGWLNSIFTNQMTQISWLQDIASSMGTNNQLLGYINSNALEIKNALNNYFNQTAAADVIDDANQDFVAEAGSLEANQAILEAQADSAFDAVDMDVSLLGTYSQSMSFWMRCINALPTISGALWEVLVFGFLIAFLIFILRLVR